MKYEFASDFRAKARIMLKGKWLIALVAGLIYALLNGSAGGPRISFSLESGHFSAGIEMLGKNIISTDGIGTGVGFLAAGGILYVFLCALVLAVIIFVIGGVVEVGYSHFNLELYEGQTPGIGELFGYFGYWKTAALAKLLRAVYVFLWSLLLVIPGIVASLSYSMTGFILAEHPELTASEAIARSKEMMYGNRWRLFCLEFSFIGWALLCALTFNVGQLWLRPYIQASYAAFYRSVSAECGYSE